MCSMIEAHFCGITSQSSIYGLTSLFTGESSHKVLVASSKRKVYCIEYSKNQQSVIFSTREVQFTYIPGRAEIISIDAFNQACHKHDFVVGITFTKSDHLGKQSQYFNVYSELTPSSEFDLDNIAQGCLSIGLEFIPFHLTHTELSIDGKKEMVWLISGNDFKIHLYKEDKTRQTYSEEPSDTCFPEFRDLNSVVMWMDFFATTDSRLTALGCKDGSVIVTSVSFVPDTHLESSWKIQHDGPISTLKLFQDSNLGNMLNNPLSEGFATENINLFVGNTLENSVVYRNILKEGLKLASQKDLPNSNKFDCVTCGLVADIDMDGNNEVLLGTYGQQLLIYKWEVNSSEDEGSYVLFHQRMFPNPLLAMSYIDIVGDGLKELLILTTKGLHILQHDLKKATYLCTSRMKWLLQNVSREELENYLKLDT